MARWATAAGLTDVEAMIEWLKRVQSTTLRQEAFPQQELDVLLSGGLAVEQVETVLDAAEHIRLLTDRSGLGPQANALLAGDQASLSQALLTLQHQLSPLVNDLLEQSDVLPADAKQRPLSSLVKDIQEAAKGYQSLLQQWLDAGLTPEASLPDLQQLPLTLHWLTAGGKKRSKPWNASSKRWGPRLQGLPRRYCDRSWPGLANCVRPVFLRRWLNAAWHLERQT